MKTVGNGYTIISDRNGSEELLSDEEFVRIGQEILSEITHKRGDFIAKSADVDYLLSEAIGWFFFPKEQTNQDIFSDLILRTEFFSFGQKKKVIESLTKNYPEKYPTLDEKNKKELKDFFNRLMKIMIRRNMLAHGELIIDMNDKTAKISYYDGNNLKNITKDIDSDFFETFQKDIDFVTEFCCKYLIAPEHSDPVSVFLKGFRP
jgi:hypothetical protein